MIEEEGKTEELTTVVMVAVMTETIGEEMTDVTIGGTTGIIETVIGNMEEEELEAIIIAEAEIITVIAVRMGSATVIATVIVTVFREKQVEGGGEETEVIEGGMVTELVGEVAVEEGNKASSDL